MRRKRINLLSSAKTLAFTLVLFSIATGIAKPQISPQEAAEARIERVLSGLRAPIAIKGQSPERWTVAESMAQSHLPGISVAVIDNDQIAWARGLGVKEAGRTDPVTTSTLFQAQSISLPLPDYGRVARHPSGTGAARVSPFRRTASVFSISRES